MNEKLLDEVGSLDDVLLENYFKTKAEFVQKKTRPRIFWQKYVSIAACFVIIFASVFAFAATKILDSLKVGSDGDVNDTPPPTTPDTDGGGASLPEGDSSQTGGLAVSSELYEIMKNAEDVDVLAVVVKSQIIAPSNFYYGGKTLSEYNTAYIELGSELKKLNELTVDGEYLKYGEALYKDGAPDGTKWTREVYEKTVAYYGDLIDKYIIDSALLKNELLGEIKSVENRRAEIEKTFDEISSAYGAIFAEENLPFFEEISEKAVIKDGKIHLEITKAELYKIASSDNGKYYFTLAS
jgi:hypothetical protein